jgi:hypothetical protein
MNKRKRTIVFGIIAITIINILIFNIINEQKANDKENRIFRQKSYEDVVKEAYRIDPSILEFDSNNKAILSIERLLLDVTNGKEHFSIGNLEHNENQDACVGFIIVTRSDEKFSVDISHICDMVDY